MLKKGGDVNYESDFEHYRLVYRAAFMPFVAVPAYAQNSDSGIEEIIATAQKREQRIQDVPVAVTALNADTLQANRVTNVMDLSGLAPGLLARPVAGGNGTPSYSMRGVFASASDPAQDRQVATYLDGVYIGGVRGVVFDLPDIQRVEVLRGPQGTLFGRNATAGAVSITTRDPAGELKLRQEVSVGNYAALRTRTTIDTPTLGVFSAFVTYVHDEKWGDVRNTGAGVSFNFNYTSPLHNLVGTTTSPKWLGSRNSESVLAAAKLEPSDSFNLVFKFDYTHNDNTPEARVPLYLGSSAPFVAAQDNTPLYGAFVMPADPTNPKRPDAVNNAWSQPGYIESWGNSLTINWQATVDLSFKNVAANRKTKTLSMATIGAIDGLEVTSTIAGFQPARTFGADFIVNF